MPLIDYSFQTAVRTIWAEARGEPLDGQRAIAHVLINRLHDGRWGKTLAAVCWAPKQFSCWNDGDPNRAAMAELHEDDPGLVRMVGMLSAAMDGSDPDPTQGARWYFNPKIVQPPWAKNKNYVQIGNHRFLKEVA